MQYHLIGVGGIGMSALARLLLKKGFAVQGSDANSSELIDALQKEGAKVFVGHSQELVQPGMTVVYSTGIPESNPELIQAKKMGLPLLHRSDLLDRLMSEKKALLVTGTHGKTTTTALLSAVLQEANFDPSFAVGGILRSLKTNAGIGQGPYFVAEADESDGSFLKTASFGAIVTNLEDEHLNYWKTSERLDQGFADFFAKVQHPEHLFWCGDDLRLKKLHPPGRSYGFSSGVDIPIFGFRQTDQGIVFNVGGHSDIFLSLFGAHNALNAAAVWALALSLGVQEEAIRRAFGSFSGAHRRLEKKGEKRGLQVYDDYGHHPTEIRATLKALKAAIKERRLVVLFQPHRYSRVKDLFGEFLECFEEADVLIATETYAAGEAPIPGIDLFPELQKRRKNPTYFLPRQGLEKRVQAHLMPHDVVLTIGAGDITKVGAGILEHFEKRVRLGLLFGGESVEHPISLLSAKNILSCLDRDLYDVELFGVTKQGRWVWGEDAFEKIEAEGADVPFEKLLQCDVLFPVFHGPRGEDGMMQGFFETLKIPYVGCDYRASSVCMQKAWTKHACMLNQVPTIPYVEIEKNSYLSDPASWFQLIERRFSYPVWVKAVHLGSSLGVTRAAHFPELLQAIDNAFGFDDTLIVEPEIVGREVEFSVLGNTHLKVAPPAEILKEDGFYDYEKKYGANASGLQIPANLTPLQRQVGESLAIRVFQMLGCKGLARIDFFVDADGHFWLNEINPMPGFTKNSGYPKMWEKGGVSLRQLCDELVVLALHKARSVA